MGTSFLETQPHSQKLLDSRVRSRLQLKAWQQRMLVPVSSAWTTARQASAIVLGAEQRDVRW